MIVASTYLANWRYIYDKRCRCQLKDNDRENKNWVQHEYKPGDLVFLLEKDVKRKLKGNTGPFKILTAHTNGAVTIQCSDHFKERVNIRCLHPAL
eukprot:3042751-Ditylum_brightwellii.AAC.1